MDRLAIPILLVALPVLSLLSWRVAGAENSGAERAEKQFNLWREKFWEAPDDPAIAWQFGRAAFDWAEFASRDEEREEIAKEGIAACRKSVALAPKLAAAHYYLALNLGQLARTKRLGALGIVDEMEQALTRTVQLDPRFDYGGAHRALGLLYSEAPGWPISIGNRAKARANLERAVALAPDFPENRLSLAEALLKWRDKLNFQRQVQALRELWPKAEKQFEGPEWEDEWADWRGRWRKLVESAR